MNLESLSTPALGIWRSLAPLGELGFVLYGDGALGLTLNHWLADSFSFFTYHTFNEQAVLKALPDLRQGVRSQIVPDTVEYLLVSHGGNVKISCSWGVKFGRVGNPRKTTDGTAWVASPYDLFAHTLIQWFRGDGEMLSRIDEFLAQGFDLAKGIRAAQLLHRKEFSGGRCLKSLVLASLARANSATAPLTDPMVAASTAEPTAPVTDPATSTTTNPATDPVVGTSTAAHRAMMEAARGVLAKPGLPKIRKIGPFIFQPGL